MSSTNNNSNTNNNINNASGNTKTQPPDQKAAFPTSGPTYRGDGSYAISPASADTLSSSLDSVVFRSVTGTATDSFSMNRPSLLNAFNPTYAKESLLGTHSSNSNASSAPVKNMFGSDKSNSFFDEPTFITVGPKISNDFEQQLTDNCNVVPEMPSYVEKYTSFVSASFPNDILRKLIEIMQGYSTVDFELAAPQYQISGTCYQNHASCDFRVNIFKKARQFLVEFQRRSGDSLVFNSFFRYVKSKSAEILEDQNAALSAAEPVSKFAPADYDIVLDSDSLGPLKSMAESPYVDVCREGMKMLARCSSTAANHVVIGSRDLTELFVKHLAIKDDEVSRYAAFILANISKNAQVCSQLVNKPHLDAIFEQFEHTENREICRQLAHLVSHISEVDAGVLKNYSRSLNKLQASSSVDNKLKSLIQATLARVDL